MGDRLGQEDPIDGHPVLEKLGSGGYATVYKVAAPRGVGDDVFALKLLSAEKSEVEAARTQFQREIELLSSINAEGIVSVVSSGIHDGRPYFVMDYCDGGTLEDRLNEAWFLDMTLSDIRELAFAIGRALWPLHSRDPAIVHRDVKPQNLLIRSRRRSRAGHGFALLDPDEEIVAGDFGLAKYVSLQTTNEETIGGFTRGYAPLEQVLGDGKIDTSADVYAASAVLISALLDVSPKQVFNEDASPFTDSDFERCGPLEPVLRKGLSGDPGQRQTNIREWCKDIDAAIGRSSGGAALVDPRAADDLSDSDSSEPDTQTGRTLAKSTRTPAEEQMPEPESETDPVQIENVAKRLARQPLPIGLVCGAVLASLLFLFFPRGESAPSINLVGPSSGVVGDPAVFLLESEKPARVWKVDGTEVEDLTSSWMVNNTGGGPQLLNVTPLSPGTYEIEAVARDGETLFAQTYTVADESTEGLRIVGVDHLRVGDDARLRLQGVEAGTEILWLAEGQEVNGYSIVLNPQTAGTLVVAAETSDEVVERTFTVLP